jgi:predicted aldo/keto reductase-like oxidoreductase
MKKTGDELSILGFGCMRLPEKKGRIDEERATKQILYAIDHGVNYVDTAMPYHMGASEPFLGRALAGGYRDRVRLATKLPPWSVKRREDMDRLLDAQLDRLKADRIDYYLVHGLVRESWKKMQNLAIREFLDKAKEDGRISHRGFSFHGDKETFKEIVDAYDWEFCQIQYNFLDEQNQAGTEGLEYASAKGLGVVVMEPLRGGNLAGRIPPEVQVVWDGAEVKRTPAEWALRWVWNRPEVTVVLSGMNEERHIEENLRIASEAQPESLTDEELQLVSRVAETYRELMKAGCTGCRYCMPCPAGVDIPTCFELYNDMVMFGDVRSARLNYLVRLGGVMSEESSCASLCTNCQKCIEACPQNLPIPELLQDVAREFEGPRLKLMLWFAKGILAIQKWGVLRKAKRSKKRR